ncbi:hypothetical protein G7Y79_00012g032250 [Physcia stellaris]|nr:hypothetical protein G7Y79_00012g032250 [Physcia stellaris]
MGSRLQIKSVKIDETLGHNIWCVDGEWDSKVSLRMRWACEKSKHLTGISILMYEKAASQRTLHIGMRTQLTGTRASLSAVFRKKVMVCIVIDEQSISTKRLAAMENTSNEYCSHPMLSRLLAGMIGRLDPM